MNKYKAIYKAFLMEELSNKLALIINLFLSSIGVIALIILWKAIYNTNSIIVGIDENEMIRYFLVVLLIAKVIKIGADDFVKDEIESGSIGTNLVKPLNYINFLFVRSCAKMTVYFSGMSLIILIISLIINLNPFIGIMNFGLFLILSVLAFLLGFEVTVIMSSLYFYFPDLRYFAFVARDLIIGFLSGMTFNIELLSGILYTIFVFLPFKYLTNFPAVVASSVIDFKFFVTGFIVEIVWIILLFVLMKLLFSKGLKIYNFYGG